MTTPAIPDTLPILGKGAHPAEARKLCAMEAAAWLAGEKHTDHPECVMPIIADCAIRVNDSVDSATRQQMWPLIIRCLGTANDDLMIQKRLVLWCAERVLVHYESRYPNDARVRTCVETTRRFLDGEATIGELTEARQSAASAASAASVYAAAAAADYVSAVYVSAAYDSAAAADAAAAVYVSAVYVSAAALLRSAALIQFLSDLLDEHDRLVSRPQASEPDWARMLEFAGVA